MENRSIPEISERNRNTVAVVLTVWLILLVLGAPLVLMGTGMVLEGGRTLSAHLFLATVWSYPAFTLLSFFLRNRAPALIWLPALPIMALVLLGYFNW